MDVGVRIPIEKFEDILIRRGSQLLSPETVDLQGFQDFLFL
jgi:hypothetical protein